MTLDTLGIENRFEPVSYETVSAHPLPKFCATEWKRPYKNIVFLTGAGISVPSGLAAFRGNDGLWNHHRVDEVASIAGFRRHPELVHNFYNSLKPQFQQAEPNAAHLAITELQQKHPAHISVLTQNIDTLHEKAGTKNVYHIHGALNETVCEYCGCVVKSWKDKNERSGCPLCGRIGRLRPNIVFFGEPIMYAEVVHELLEKADLFIAVGTSGLVPPASRFVETARRYLARTLEFNLEPVQNSETFDGHIFGDVSETLPRFVQTLLE